MVNNTKDGNPFTVHGEAGVLGNPEFAYNLDEMFAHVNADQEETLRLLKYVPTAIWIDHATKIAAVEAALADAASHRSGKAPPLLVFVLYDLPNRDCNAAASMGEICCYRQEDGSCDLTMEGDCADGLRVYTETVVRPFAAAIAKYDGAVPVAVIVEPDSIANLVTNADVASCGSATATAYRQGLTFALSHLREKAPNVYLYLDAGHGGWLGWDEMAQKLVRMVCDLNLAQYLRGFSTNVANYNQLGAGCPEEAFEGEENAAHYCNWVEPESVCCVSESKCGEQLLDGYNSGIGELMFAQTLVKYAQQECTDIDFRPFMIIDSGRNGAPAARDSSCNAWCNVRGARVGKLPTTTTGLDVVDALFWIKTPGESDGCSKTLPDGSECPRFDESCGKELSLGSRGGEPAAPEAGRWYSWQMLELASDGDAVRVDHVFATLRGVLPSRSVLETFKKASESKPAPGPSARTGANPIWLTDGRPGAQSTPFVLVSPTSTGQRHHASRPTAGGSSMFRGINIDQWFRTSSAPQSPAPLWLWIFAWTVFSVGLALATYMLLPKSIKWKLGCRARLPKLSPSPKSAYHAALRDEDLEDYYEEEGVHGAVDHSEGSEHGRGPLDESSDVSDAPPPPPPETARVAKRSSASRKAAGSRCQSTTRKAHRSVCRAALTAGARNPYEPAECVVANATEDHDDMQAHAPLAKPPPALRAIQSSSHHAGDQLLGGMD